MDPIRHYRREAKLTREQLASRARCSVAWVQQLEAGCRPGKSAVLRRVTAVLAAELGLDYGDLLADVGGSGVQNDQGKAGNVGAHCSE